MITVLQNFMLPGLAFPATEEMYVRTNDKVRICLKNRTLVFQTGGRASFDTFFNGITVPHWRGTCGIKDLRLTLRGNGKFLLRFGLHRTGLAHLWLDENFVEMSAGEELVMPLPFWPKLDSGILYVCLEALGVAELSGGSFSTATPPARPVRLGIVITHYNRREQLLPALARLNRDLKPGQKSASGIEIVVIDNSQNVTQAEVGGAALVPNRNLGGSGGFMRGLLYLKDNDFSHCLFMDDDASCESESILRCHALLQYLPSTRMAVAGSLMREAEPHRLFEKGSRFDVMCRPQKSWLDMRYVPDLLAAERDELAADYGGWWFFGFAIASVRHYSFPFFVRGDDIQFCILNKFEIFTANGVTCWCEDFALKNGPLPIYLDVRSHLVQSLCVRGSSRLAVVQVLIRFFCHAAYSYNYGTARAVTLALGDFMRGPGFWTKDMEMRGKRAEVKAFSKDEEMRPINYTDPAPVRHVTGRETWLRRWVRILTLNGFLLPGFMLKKKRGFQVKGFSGSLPDVFRFRSVVYEHEASQTGYVATHDKRQFFSVAARFVLQLGRFFFAAKRLRRRYQEALPALTSESFWRAQYAEALTPVGMAGAEAPLMVEAR